MKTLATLLAILLYASSTEASERHPWTTTDTIMQVGVTALLEVDREQTRYITTSERFGEDNKLIGARGHRDTVNAYFAASMLAHAAVSYVLPDLVEAVTGSYEAGKYSRTVWQSIWIVTELSVVNRNAAAGVQLKF